MQNVGAYGQEASQVVQEVKVFDMESSDNKIFPATECNFSYRSSTFNQSAKGKFLILSVTLCLNKNGLPNLTYKDLQQRFASKSPTLNEIRSAVTQIRDAKFPYPKQAILGNAGSFFKNPLFTLSEYSNLSEKIKHAFGEDVFLKLESKKIIGADIIKIPAAFLLDICGVKDLQIGGAAVNANQPLVIINRTGTATALDVLGLANRIKNIIQEKTGIALQFEPELVGFNGPVL